MRFLLDENIPKRASVALRSEGHDVVRVQETPLHGAGDEAVWNHAARDQRIFVTADLDFPLREPVPPGMLLIRGFERVSVTTFASILTDTIRSRGDDLHGHLVVLSPGRVRFRKL